MRKMNGLLVVSMLSMLVFVHTSPVWGGVVQLRLRVESSTMSSVTLAWNVFPVGPVKGFQLFRSTDGRNFDLLAKTPSSQLSFVDATVKPGIVYTYKVRAEQDLVDGEYSDFSQPVPAVAIPGKPFLSVGNRANGGTEIPLNWTPVPGAHGYEVYQSKMERGQYGPPQLIGNVSGPSFLKSGALSTSDYKYVVRAYTRLGGEKVFGEYSNAVVSQGEARAGGGVTRT